MRTLEQIQADLTSAYIARAEIIKGKRVAKTRFASADSTFHYEFSDLVTFDQIQNYIILLEAERDAVSGTTTQVFLQNAVIAMTYRKGGV